MAKNLMPDIVKLLGVEYGEKFKVHSEEYVFGDDLFFFDKEQGLVHICHDGSLDRLNNVLYDILNGSYEIVKLPYKPQNGDTYWMLYFATTGGVNIFDYIWDGNIQDFVGLQLGIIYRTKAEAEAHMAEDYKRLTGKKLEVQNNE